MSEKIKSAEYDVVMDAIFGFSFTGDSIREPFATIVKDLKDMRKNRQAKTPAIVSVDTPSGWHVEKGNILDTFEADMLVSLTAPKTSAAFHSGPHYLGGRFVPQKIFDKYQFQIPQ